MKAVIMAGGLGTRLRPLTNSLPKHVLPVAGKPMIEYVIRSMVNGGFEDIILTTGYIYDKIVDVVGDATQYGARAFYSIESKRLGTAGSVKRVEPLLDDTFVVGSGDVLADVDIKELYEFHKKKGAMATMALTSVDNPREYGIVGLDDDSKIIRFKEKPAPEEAFSNLINAGIYILEPDVLRHVPAETKFDFSKNLFPILLEEGTLYGKALSGLWRDVGRPHDLIGANKDMTERLGGRIIEGKLNGRAEGAVFIAEGAEVEDGALVKDSFIYPGALVEKGAVVERSIVLDGSIISEGAVVKNCIIPWKLIVYPGVKVENTVLESEGVGE